MWNLMVNTCNKHWTNISQGVYLKNKVKNTKQHSCRLCWMTSLDTHLFLVYHTSDTLVKCLWHHLTAVSKKKCPCALIFFYSLELSLYTESKFCKGYSYSVAPRSPKMYHMSLIIFFTSCGACDWVITAQIPLRDSAASEFSAIVNV